ncbi:uncharacterized protein FFB20_02279 [Fusarium fujikuroi]|nr:uncharacterized protein Y057_388 [Fusarium fujikuroi]SCN66592.1 uncharacterized protein FFB20_02279 [Fusarium fujikuroi]SCO07922.1 uncharacterized protein FFC1_10580 [Fusarium fujikuroi]
MSIPGKFMIIVGGKPVANPRDNGEPMIQAQPGDPAAIFEFRDGRLFSGEWALGRLNYEDRSMMPKRVLWRKREEVNDLQPVQFQEDGGPPELKFSGSGLTFFDNKLYSPIIEGENQPTQIRPVPF